MEQNEHKQQGVSRLLEEAGIVTHPDGSEREPTPEPHPFDTGAGNAQGGENEADGGSQPGDKPGAESHDDAAAPAPEHGGGGEAAEDPEAAAEPGDAGSDESEPRTEPGEDQGELDLAALAESLEISVEELYQVEIPLGGEDGNFTLGEFKDHVREFKSLGSQREILDQDRTSAENEKLVARQELQTVVAMLGDSISPELLDHARRQLRSEIARERDLTFEAIPEWSDQETAERDRSAINDYLRGYGFTDAELAQVYDHRLLKLARDSQRNQIKLRTAAEQAVPARSLPGKPGTKQGASKLRRRARRQMIDSAAAGGPDEKVAAVSRLITGD